MPESRPRPALVSPRTRRAFRELATGIVLREIEGMWQDEGFAPGPGNAESGERRNLYQCYLDAVDWADPGHVGRALRVFEVTAQGIDPEYTKGAFGYLTRDGYRVEENGRITGGPVAVLRDGALADLADPSAIREGLQRISRALQEDDPTQAIGSAKELIESTAKVVLHHVGQQVDPKDDVPQLVLKAQKALSVHPTSAAAGPDTSEAVKKILGGATTITTGLAELRNRGYGTGHGQARSRVGLGARHARMAVTGAQLWCEFILDTLADPAAPWRSRPTSGAPPPQ